jgi:hypothetical protein
VSKALCELNMSKFTKVIVCAATFGVFFGIAAVVSTYLIVKSTEEETIVYMTDLVPRLSGKLIDSCQLIVGKWEGREVLDPSHTWIAEYSADGTSKVEHKDQDGTDLYTGSWYCEDGYLRSEVVSSRLPTEPMRYQYISLELSDTRHVYVNFDGIGLGPVFEAVGVGNDT